MTISGLFNTYFFFAFFFFSSFCWEIRNKRFKRLPLAPAVAAIKDPHSEFLDQICGSFFSLLVFVFVTTSLSEWVSELVSEFLALLPRSSTLAAHTEFERGRESQRERSGVFVCVCVRQYTCLHQYMHARNTHWLSRTHDMHSTFALLLLCSALPRHPLKSSLALRSSSQSNLNNDTERFGVLSLSLSFSASKTFSLLKCPKSSSNNL